MWWVEEEVVVGVVVAVVGKFLGCGRVKSRRVTGGTRMVCARKRRLL